MAKRPIVSVVMPAFNAGKYIKESIESVLRQTVSDIELIVVDDKSTDNTWDILSLIAKNDKRCRIFQLEHNSGSAKYPRDYAVSKSESDFICWIDADDMVGTNYIESLLKRQKETEADIVCSKMVAFDQSGNIRYTLPMEDFDYEQETSGREAVMYTIGASWKINVNGFLARRSLWCSTRNYLDTEVNHMNADDLASREMLLNSKKVAFAKIEYQYRLHQEAITKKLSHKLFEPLITDKMVIGLFVERLGQGEENAEAWSQYFSHWISMMRLYAIHSESLSSSSKEKVLQLLKEHKKNFKKCLILKDRNLSICQKLLLILPFRISRFIFKKINK